MQKDLNQRPADVILRSSDKQLFYSWKIFLTFASPLFSDMFTLPQPDTSDNVDARCDGLPVVDSPEDSCTLGHILTLCHPPSCTGEQFRVSKISDLRAVLEATVKYDMENVRCVALKELSNPLFLCEDPVRVYALACQHQCHEAAQLAAKYTLALPTLVRGYLPDLEKIHAGRLCRLLLYREACMTAACSLAADHGWIVYTEWSCLFGCDGHDSDEALGWTTVSHPPSRKYRSGWTENKSVHTWWLKYMKQSEYALRRSPRGETVKDRKLVADVLTAISTSKCRRCNGSEVSETFRSFVDIFSENIEGRVAEVKIDLGF